MLLTSVGSVVVSEMSAHLEGILETTFQKQTKSPCQQSANYNQPLLI